MLDTKIILYIFTVYDNFKLSVSGSLVVWAYCSGCNLPCKEPRTAARPVWTCRGLHSKRWEVTNLKTIHG